MEIGVRFRIDDQTSSLPEIYRKMHTEKKDSVLLTEVAHLFQMEQLETRVAFSEEPPMETTDWSIWIGFGFKY